MPSGEEGSGRKRHTAPSNTGGKGGVIVCLRVRRAQGEIDAQRNTERHGETQQNAAGRRRHRQKQGYPFVRTWSLQSAMGLLCRTLAALSVFSCSGFSVAGGSFTWGNARFSHCLHGGSPKVTLKSPLSLAKSLLSGLKSPLSLA